MIYTLTPPTNAYKKFRPQSLSSCVILHNSCSVSTSAEAHFGHFLPCSVTHSMKTPNALEKILLCLYSATLYLQENSKKTYCHPPNKRVIFDCLRAPSNYPIIVDPAFRDTQCQQLAAILLQILQRALLSHFFSSLIMHLHE